MLAARGSSARLLRLSQTDKGILVDKEGGKFSGWGDAADQMLETLGRAKAEVNQRLPRFQEIPYRCSETQCHA